MSISKSNIGVTLIILGVVFSAIEASFIPIKWDFFSLGIIIIITGVIFQRTGKKQEIETNKGEGLTFDGFIENIKKLKLKIDFFKKNLTNENIETIDDVINDVMPDVEAYRFAIVEKIGISGYTELISLYAKAERMVARGVSATIDEYFDEAKKCFSDATVMLENTLIKADSLTEKTNG